MVPELRDAFASIGATATFETAGRSFEIDVVVDRNQQLFRIRFPAVEVMNAKVADVRPTSRQLILEVSGWRFPFRRRYLCGWRDGRWFVKPLGTKSRISSVAPREMCGGNLA